MPNGKKGPLCNERVFQLFFIAQMEKIANRMWVDYSMAFLKLASYQKPVLQASFHRHGPCRY